MKKVLIIDDDPDILEVLQLTLEMAGYTTKTILHGDELFREVSVFKPDIVLLDILLSGSDGRVLCKKLKSNITTKAIPVILISAHMSAKKNITEIGANDFIAKPFDIDDLIKRVGKFVN